MAMQKYVLKFKRYIKTLLGQSAVLKLKRFLKETEIIVKKILVLIDRSIEWLMTLISLTLLWVSLLVVYYFMAVTLCLVWAFLLIIHYYLIKVPAYILKEVKQKTYPRIRKILDKQYIKTPIQHIKYHPATLKVSSYLKALASASKEKLSRINHLRKQFIKTIKEGLLGLRQLLLEILEQLCKTVPNVCIQLRKIWHITIKGIDIGCEWLMKPIGKVYEWLGTIIFLTLSWVLLLVVYYLMAVAVCFVWTFLLIIHYYLIKTPVYILKKVKQKTYLGISKVFEEQSIKTSIQHIKYHPATLKVSECIKAFISVGKEKLAKINHLRKQFIKTIREGLLGLRQLLEEILEQLCKTIPNVCIWLRKIWHITIRWIDIGCEWLMKPIGKVYEWLIELICRAYKRFKKAIGRFLFILIVVLTFFYIILEPKLVIAFLVWLIWLPILYYLLFKIFKPSASLLFKFLFAGVPLIGNILVKLNLCALLTLMPVSENSNDQKSVRGFIIEQAGPYIEYQNRHCGINEKFYKNFLLKQQFY